MAFSPADGGNPQECMRSWTIAHATAEFHTKGIARQGSDSERVSKEVPENLRAADDAVQGPKTGSENHDNHHWSWEFRTVHSDCDHNQNEHGYVKHIEDCRRLEVQIIGEYEGMTHVRNTVAWSMWWLKGQWLTWRNLQLGRRKSHVLSFWPGVQSPTRQICTLCHVGRLWRCRYNRKPCAVGGAFRRMWQSMARGAYSSRPRRPKAPSWRLKSCLLMLVSY